MSDLWVTGTIMVAIASTFLVASHRAAPGVAIVSAAVAGLIVTLAAGFIAYLGCGLG